MEDDNVCSEITRERFFKKARRVLGLSEGDEELGMIYDAYRLAKDTHREQERDNGERFFEHPRRVAWEILELGYGQVREVVLALVHDCWEDGFLRLALFEERFGAQIAHGVQILSKEESTFDGSTGKITKTQKDLDDYWDIILNSPAWVRRVKLADRLDNLRSMEVWCAQRKRKYLQETRDYVLPIEKRTNSVLSRKIREEFRRRCGELEDFNCFV